MSINSALILFCLFCICRIKSGSVIQTKHFDIKMSLEIRQAKSFFLTLWVMFFASFHFFIFFILRITINCNYLFTKHFKYKTLIYLCQRPPPEKFVVFYLYKRWRGKTVMPESSSDSSDVIFLIYPPVFLLQHECRFVWF